MTLWDILAGFALFLLLDWLVGAIVRRFQRRQWVVLQVTPDGHCILHDFRSTRDGKKVIHSVVDLDTEAEAVTRIQESAAWN